jgi:hypothetical protein
MTVSGESGRRAGGSGQIISMQWPRLPHYRTNDVLLNGHVGRH